MRKVIEATEGNYLTNGEVFGKTIYLAEGESGEDFYEIAEDELEDIEAEADIEDYQAALSKLGVSVDD